MRQENVIRNMAVVILRKANPKVFSFGNLGQLFNVQKHVAHKVYLRDKGKYGLPNENIVNKGV